jgi:hypothetical protein
VQTVGRAQKNGVRERRVTPAAARQVYLCHQRSRVSTRNAMAGFGLVGWWPRA